MFTACITRAHPGLPPLSDGMNLSILKTWEISPEFFIRELSHRASEPLQYVYSIYYEDLIQGCQLSSGDKSFPSIE